jgi:acyl-CoA dehydrogenase
VIWNQEESKYEGLPGGVFGIGQGMAAPTLMTWADEAPRRASCRSWPAARRSGVSCSASRPAAPTWRRCAPGRSKDGDEWVINGQKIWTSGAHYSDFGILVVRTDPTVPKHKGLTYFYLDMKSPGIEIKPIKQISGDANFNEVYFTDVRIPDSQRLGEVGQGWQVSLTTLMNERASIGAGGSQVGFDRCSSWRRRCRSTTGRPSRTPRCGRSWPTGTARKPACVHLLPHLSALVPRRHSRARRTPSASWWGRPRPRTWRRSPSTCWSSPAPSGTRNSSEEAGLFQGTYMSIPGLRIAGGTDEIMANIIAERVLGLPQEPRVDKGIPFNEVPTGAGKS